LETARIIELAGEDLTREGEAGRIAPSEKWKVEGEMIGRVSHKERVVDIFNTLTKHKHRMYVCEEDTLDLIRTKYFTYNTHGTSYTWKFLEEELDAVKTLSQNGIEDESEEFVRLHVEDDYYVPTIFLYFNDDLTEM
jgi:hypothetical protein